MEDPLKLKILDFFGMPINPKINFFISDVGRSQTNAERKYCLQTD